MAVLETQYYRLKEKEKEKKKIDNKLNSCSAAHLSSDDVHLIRSDYFNQPIRSKDGKRKDITEAVVTYALINTKIGHFRVAFCPCAN